MIKTGDWTTFDLIKYLVSIQSTLAPQEFERLRNTSAFPKEGSGKEQSAPGAGRKIQRHKAMDLYEPVETFRELGLPIIDWGAGNRWRPASEEGEFYCRAAIVGTSNSPILQANSFCLWV